MSAHLTRASASIAIVVVGLLVASCGGSGDAEPAAEASVAPTSDTAAPAATIGIESSVADGSPGTDASATSELASVDAFPVTIEHAFGETTIAAEPERVVAIGTGSEDIAAALGVVPVAIGGGRPGANDDGVLPWFAEFYDPDVTDVLDTSDGYPVEQIAAADPDVILAPYEGFDDATYQLLDEIAPTVAYVGAPWSTPWEVQTEMVGRALGRADAATDLVESVHRHLAELADAHPEFSGVTFSFLFFYAGEASVFLPGDTRVELVADLGFVPSDGVADLGGDSGEFFAPISLERLGEVDADLVITHQSDAAADPSTLPGIGGLGAFERGAVVAYGTDDGALMSAMIPTALSIPWAADHLAEDLGAVVSSL